MQNRASTHAPIDRLGQVTPPSPRRILLSSGSFDHIIDGVTLTLNRLVRHLEADGFEVMVVAPSVDEPAMAASGRFVELPSVPLPGRGEYRLGTIMPPSTRRQIEQFDPQLVHVATPDLIGRWLTGFARRRSIPLVTTYHTDFRSYLRYYNLEGLEALLDAYLRYFYRRCDLVCVPSRSMADSLCERGIEGRMRIWGRGVEVDRFSPDHRSDRWREGIGADEATTIVNYTGRLVLEKNVEFLPRVAARLRASGLSWRMVIVGEGPARVELERAMPEAIFTGHLEGEDLARAYASSDVFCFPSTTETFGNVVLEAMASGLPVVACRATGSNDLVGPETGLLVPSDDPASMAEAVVDLAADARRRRRFGRAARLLAEGRTWDAVLDRMVDHYREACRVSRLRS